MRILFKKYEANFKVFENCVRVHYQDRSGLSISDLPLTRRSALFPSQRLVKPLKIFKAGHNHLSCQAAGFCFDAACQHEKDVLFLLSLALPIVLASLSFIFLGRKQDEEVGYVLGPDFEYASLHDSECKSACMYSLIPFRFLLQISGGD